MLNAQSSRAGKERGQQLALDLSGEWRERVLLELQGWIAIHKARGNTTMTMEQFRAEARNHPESPKAWGPLPAVACKAGLIAPLTHPDGSPVMRRAESVKTHSHPVRVWSLLPAGAPAASSGSGAELLGAVAAYHRQRGERRHP